jgi:hypothetical protein
MRRHFITSGLIVAGILLSACSGGSNPAAGNAYVPQSLAIPAGKTNVIQNGDFATGKLAPGWTALGSRYGVGTVVSTQHYTGDKYSGFMGSTSDPAVNGPHGMQQTVTVPKKGELTFWHEGNSTDEPKYGYYEVDVYNGKKKLETCYGGSGHSDTKLGWKLGKCSLAKYAGKSVTLEFYVDDNGYAKAYVNWYLDDVSLTSK